MAGTDEKTRARHWKAYGFRREPRNAIFRRKSGK
jgi:hypothetical protein